MSSTAELTGRARAAEADSGFGLPVILGMVAVSIFAFAALVLLAGYSEDLRPDEPTTATAGDTSAVGYSGLQDLLRELGHEVRVDPYPHRGDWDGRELRLYFPTPAFTESRRDRIDGEAPGLLVLPKWAVVPIREDSTEVIRRSEPGLSSAAALILSVMDDFHGLNTSRVVQGDWALPGTDTSARLSYPRWVVHLSDDEEAPTDASDPESGTSDDTEANAETAENEPDDGNGSLKDALEEALASLAGPDNAAVVDEMPPSDDLEALLHTVGINGGEFLVLAEPDLLSNHGIATEPRARAALSVLSLALDHYAITDPVFVFDDSLRRRDTSQNLLKLMTRPPFLAATLCLLAGAALLGWQAFNRFGDGDDRVGSDAPSRGPRALAETAAAFIAGVGRIDALAPNYADVVKRQALEDMGVSAWDRARSDAALRSREALRDVRPTLDDIFRNTTLTPMARARALQRWKKEIT